MTRIGPGATAAMALLLLAGCNRQATAPTINTSMTEVMEPTAQTIWDIMSSAYNARGDGLDPARLSDADWQALDKASRALKARADGLALADHLVVVADNQPILGSQAVGIKGDRGTAWDAVSARQIQSRIDAQPALFAQKARALADAAAQITQAADARNAARFYAVASGLDEVCDSCHEPFWGTDEPPPYPRGKGAAASPAT